MFSIISCTLLAQAVSINLKMGWEWTGTSALLNQNYFNCLTFIHDEICEWSRGVLFHILLIDWHVIIVLWQNWNCSVNLTFFFLPCLVIMFDYLMKEAYFFNCGENLSAKGMTYLTNSLFDYRSPENNSIRAEFILDAAHHKVRELLCFFQKYFLMLSNESPMIFRCVLLEDWFASLGHVQLNLTLQIAKKKKKGNKNMSKRNLKTPPILKPKSNAIVFKSANYKTSTGKKKKHNTKIGQKCYQKV